VTAPIHVLLISGSLRSNSTNSAVVATAAADAPESVVATVYQAMAGLPHFNPDDDVDPLPAPVAELRDRIASSNAVLICTPEYAGALPGSFKNLLDWTVGGVAIQGKPVAWVNASAAPTGAANAHQSLRIVLGYLDADIVESACRHIAVPRGVVGPDGLITDPAVRSQVIDTVTALAHHAETARSLI
jgi:chromate reductase, NAD(P)H dehydrogenase (quinone)